MSIAVGCHGCGATFKVRDDYAGKRGRCPKCNTILDIPAFVTALTPVAIQIDDDDRRVRPMARGKEVPPGGSWRSRPRRWRCWSSR